MKRRQIGERCDLHGSAAPASVRVVEKLSGRLVIDQSIIRVQSLGAEHEVSGGKIRRIDRREDVVVKHDLVAGAFRKVLDPVNVTVGVGLDIKNEVVGSSSAIQDIVAVAADELVASGAA